MSLIEYLKRIFGISENKTSGVDLSATSQGRSNLTSHDSEYKVTLVDQRKPYTPLKPIEFTPAIPVRELNRQATRSWIRPILRPIVPKPIEEIEVTEEFQKVIELAGSVPLLLVNGKAGTGKTTLIHYLNNLLRVNGKNIVIVAPTGVAAIMVGGSTIHSFFRFPPRVIMDEDIRKLEDRKLYSTLDLLIIDEISMVRADILDAIDKFLRLNGPNSSQPFGGVSLLLVGDLFQLPPVVDRTEESILIARNYTSPFFFSAHSLQESKLVPVELTKVFRQRDVAFAELLNRLRMAEDLDSIIPTINQRCICVEPPPENVITLTCTNIAADQINRAKIESLPGMERLFVGEIKGKFPVPEDKLPSPLRLALKVGAQVMFTKNDHEKRWVNGTLGIVTAIEDNSIHVKLISNRAGETHDIHRENWDYFQYEYNYSEERIKAVSIGEYHQYPLMLAWAITIHKSQGKTLERVIVDFGNGAFASGQAYVALSRCRSLQDITLVRPLNPYEVICDQQIKRFYLAMIQYDSRYDFE